MTKFLTLLFSLLASLVTAQQVTIDNVYNRKVQSLNGQWSYIIDPLETGYYDYRYQPSANGFFKEWPNADKTSLLEYSFEPSVQLTVPGDWNHQDDRLQYYEGTIWYQRKFMASPKPHQVYYLWFGAVNYEAHIWLNGKKVGQHTGGYTSFAFEVGQLLQQGQNTLVVKVDNKRTREAVPTLNFDWWNYGGITRDVLLVEVPSNHLKEVRCNLKDLNTKTIEIRIPATGITGQFADLKGRIGSLSLTFPLEKQADGSWYGQAKVPKLQLWSAELPRLYQVEIVHDGTPVWADQIGFRHIAVKGEQVLLNGKSVFLKGICVHEEIGEGKRRAVSRDDALVLLTRAKALGCNFVRLAHYPHNEHTIRLADEMGIMVWSEIPVYWTIDWQNTATYANATNQLQEMVARDLNRASIIIWSVGNETPVSEARNRFMKGLVAKAKQLDQTRLISAAMEKTWKDKEKTVMLLDDVLGDDVDILACNEYLGWYEGLPERCKSVTFETKQRKPLIISEFGGEALFGFHADSLTRFSEEFQASMYRQQLTMLSRTTNLVGMTPWLLNDFRSPKRLNGIYQQGWNRKGIYSDRGERKLVFDVLKRYYESK